MKKYFIYILIAVVIVGIILFLFLRNNVFFKETPSTISGTKLSTNINNVNNSENITDTEISKEQEIASFSTEIRDNSEGRVTNISITCSLLNNTIIGPGETFSFNEIVGQPSSARGYQEATVIIDGEHETGIGGGNCQVSSTLYNAVLAVPYLTVTERSAHGLPVTYVPEGQDAAVSYGSLDLKFRNDGDKSIRIDMSSDGDIITANIIEL